MMESQSYTDFSLRLNRQTVSKRIPIDGTIEVTRRCPLKCIHCYNNLPIGDPTAKLSELTYQEHCRIIDEIADAGCLWLLYTGGEIFVRKDFIDIYTYAKKKGLVITLFTSGILLTQEIADYLAEWRPFSIEITLYGRTKDTYERITGVPGSYEKCMEGIHLLIERELPLKLKTMVITINKKEIWGMKDYVEEDLGLEFRFDPIINPRIDTFDGAKPRFLNRGKKRRSVSTLSPSAELGALSSSEGIPWALVRRAHHPSNHPEQGRGTDRGVERVDCSQNPLKVRLSPQEVVELDLKDSKRMTEWGRFCEKFNGPVHSSEEPDDLYHCGAGISSFGIDPCGGMRVCALSCDDGYDLRRGSFRDGWEGFLLDARKKKLSRQTKCIHCEIKAMCGMCPANAQLENRDPEEPVDYLCQVAHLRAKALGLQIKPHGECEYCKD